MGWHFLCYCYQQKIIPTDNDISCVDVTNIQIILTDNGITCSDVTNIQIQACKWSLMKI